METTLEKIIRKTGRKPVECKCEICKNQCKTPCLGTPQDILRLLRAGYKKQLIPTIWGVGIRLGKISFSVIMIQPRQTPSGCIFFKNGLCELHEAGLKPTEGKLSYHTVTAENCEFSKTLTWNVAQEWLKKENEETILQICRELV